MAELSKVRAVGLFSGGLDSQLAVIMMQRQGIDVLALHATHPFHARRGLTTEKIREYAARLGVEYVEEDMSSALIAAVDDPRHGHGKNLNPCIDCRILCMRLAKKYLDSGQARFVFTGEVVGERPMSQRKDIMIHAARAAGLEGLILRPLSARLLPPTIPEQKSWVDRDLLGDISGRSRKPQLALAREDGLEEYPNPAGGCLLTDPGFCRRLSEARGHGEMNTSRGVEMLKIGRHFRTPAGRKMIVGRNHEENLVLSDFLAGGEVLMEPVSAPGPSVLIRETAAGTPPGIEEPLALMLRYMKTPPATLEIRIINVDHQENRKIVVEQVPADESELERWRI